MTVQTESYRPYVDVGNGIRLYVEDTCSGSSGTIVFIPGWAISSKVFEYQFQHLVPLGFRCIGIDLRGFGNSDKPWGDYSYDIFVDDMREVFDALELDDFVLVGHSMGAAISMHYAATQKDDRVKKLLLVSPAAPCFVRREDFPFGVPRAVVDQMIEDCLKDRVKLMAKFGESLFAKPLSPGMSRYFHSLVMASSPYATLKCLEALRDNDLRQDMGQIKVPTLIIHGGNDAIAPYALGEALNKGIPGSRLVCFEECGHGVFYEELAEFNRQLIEFATA